MEIPKEILSQLRLVCLDLPEAYEEKAWTGIRFCVRKKNFAHVLTIEQARPPAYAKASGLEGPSCILTLRYSPRKIEASRFLQFPYFRPVWWPNILGVVLENPDWDELGELLVESYRLLAPKKLASLLEER